MMDEQSTTAPSSHDQESTCADSEASIGGSLVGARRMLFERQIVSNRSAVTRVPNSTNSVTPSSARVSRVSIRTLPLNDRAVYSSSSSSERESRTPSPQPRLPPSPSLLNDPSFAKRTSYHHAVFKNAEMILTPPSALKSKDEQETFQPKPEIETEENGVEKCMLPTSPSFQNTVFPEIVAETEENRVEERISCEGKDEQENFEIAQMVSIAEADVSTVSSSEQCQPKDEQDVEVVAHPITAIHESATEENVPQSALTCPDSVVIISQDLSSARDNDRISSLSSSRNIRESIVVAATNEDDCNDDDNDDDNDRRVDITSSNSIDYPEELNPFADEDDESVNESKKEDRSFSSSLNPFGSDSEEEEVKERSKTTENPGKQKEERTSTNPFWSGSEDENEERMSEQEKPKPSARKVENGSRNKTPVPLPRSIRTSVINVSPQPSPRRSVDSSPASCRKLSADSLSSRSGSSSTQSTIRKKKPAPPPPPAAAVIMRHENTSASVLAANEQRVIQHDALGADRNTDKNVPKHITTQDARKMSVSASPWKHKKGPAPARPIPQRRPVKEMPIADIHTEISDIEIREQELERQAAQLEQMIRERTETESAESPGVEEMVLQSFELVNEKNELFRRRSELINMRKMHHLEEEHAELEYQIRCLMLKPTSNKTDSDKEREEALIKKLLEVVERRNEIIEAMEKDRQRETVEDQSVIKQLDQDGKNITKSPDKKKEEKKSKKQKKEKVKKDDQQQHQLHFGEDKEKHSPGQLIKQKFMTMTLRHSTKKLHSPRLSN